jgi:signal transduction histidine kinase
MARDDAGALLSVFGSLFGRWRSSFSSRCAAAFDSDRTIAQLAHTAWGPKDGAPSAITAEVEGTPRDLHPILRDEVYRIAGEALRNAFHHAQAQRIEVEIRYDERRFRLRVRDNGKGIDPKLLNEDGRAGHYGLPGMRERAKLMGGKLAVWSELDSGAEVELSIPASRAYEISPVRWRSRFAEKLFGKDTEMKS